MPQIVCYREGRQGFHVGDVLHVPEGVTAIDANYFAFADETNDEAAKKAKELADLAEIEKLEKQLAATKTSGD